MELRQVPCVDLGVHGQVRPVLVGGPGGRGDGRLESSFIAGNLAGAGPAENELQVAQGVYSLYYWGLSV